MVLLIVEICWAIVLAHMLQAILNITNTKDYVEFLYDDLVVHLKLKKETKKQAQSSSLTKKKAKTLKLANLQKAVDHIAVNGLLKEKCSGSAKVSCLI